MNWKVEGNNERLTMCDDVSVRSSHCHIHLNVSGKLKWINKE